MSDTFQEMLNEDIRGAFRRLGSAIVSSSKRAGEDARTKFWAALGDAKAEGQLDFNFMMEDLRDHYEYFCGQMQYEQTAKSFIDFIGVLSQKPEFDTKQLMAMMGGRTDPMSMRSPDEGEIDEAFEAISNKQVQGQDIPEVVLKLEALAKKNQQNKALIFEYMRTVVQNMPEMLERAEWARLLPFVDRYLSDQELKLHLTTVAKNMLRSRAVQDYAGGEAGGKESADGDSEEGDSENSSNAVTNPKTNRDFTQPLNSASGGRHEQIDVIARRLTQLYFTDDYQKAVIDGKIDEEFNSDGTAVHTKFGKRTNAISANALAWMIALGPTASPQASVIIEMGLAHQKAIAGNIYPRAFAKAIYDHLLSGGNVDDVTAEFNDRFKSTDQQGSFCLGILNAASRAFQKGQPQQDQNQESDDAAN